MSTPSIDSEPVSPDQLIGGTHTDLSAYSSTPRAIPPRASTSTSPAPSNRIAPHDHPGGAQRPAQARRRWSSPPPATPAPPSPACALRGYDDRHHGEKTSKEKVDAMKPRRRGDRPLAASPITGRRGHENSCARGPGVLRRGSVQQPVQRGRVRVDLGPEIWTDLGSVTHFIAGGSTAGPSPARGATSSRRTPTCACSWRIRADRCFGTTS